MVRGWEAEPREQGEEEEEVSGGGGRPALAGPQRPQKGAGVYSKMAKLLEGSEQGVT